MARKGLLLALCAGALVAAGPASPAPGEDPNGAVASALAVQTAMQQAKDHLLRRNPRAAVEVLEEHLARINGNQHYLALLRDAYREHIKDLKLAKDEAAAQLYQQRLNILEPGVARAA